MFVVFDRHHLRRLPNQWVAAPAPQVEQDLLLFAHMRLQFCRDPLQ
jgi:hypothetical protein